MTRMWWDGWREREGVRREPVGNLDGRVERDRDANPVEDRCQDEIAAEDARAAAATKAAEQLAEAGDSVGAAIALENERTKASRLTRAGHRELAEHYRTAARLHEEAADRLDLEAGVSRPSASGPDPFAPVVMLRCSRCGEEVDPADWAAHGCDAHREAPR